MRNNPVADYMNYRSSAAGGSYNAQMYDINELTDQFAFGIQKHPLAIRNFFNYARNTYFQKPEFVLLIGRGMAYTEYRSNQADPECGTTQPGTHIWFSCIGSHACIRRWSRFSQSDTYWTTRGC